MVLIQPGTWHDTVWADRTWHSTVWLHYGVAVIEPFRLSGRISTSSIGERLDLKTVSGRIKTSSVGGN